MNLPNFDVVSKYWGFPSDDSLISSFILKLTITGE